MALTEEPSQTYEAIETLGSFYRQSLSQGEQMIPEMCIRDSLGKDHDS